MKEYSKEDLLKLKEEYEGIYQQHKQEMEKYDEKIFKITQELEEREKHKREYTEHIEEWKYDYTYERLDEDEAYPYYNSCLLTKSSIPIDFDYFDKDLTRDIEHYIYIGEILGEKITTAFDLHELLYKYFKKEFTWNEWSLYNIQLKITVHFLGNGKAVIKNVEDITE